MLTVDANVWVAAFDPQDRFHSESKAFLEAVNRRGLALHGPAIVLLEAGCALSRRTNSPGMGAAVRDRLRRHPLLELHPVDDALVHTALDIGSRQLLRGTDALYAATASVVGAPLVSWDDDLVRRAGAATPASWMTVNG